MASAKTPLLMALGAFVALVLGVAVSSSQSRAGEQSPEAAPAAIVPALDCDAGAFGIQHVCAADGSVPYTVPVVFKNHTGAPVSMSFFSIEVSQTEAWLTPAAGVGNGIDANPDLNQAALSDAWSCASVLDADSRPEVVVTSMACFLNANAAPVSLAPGASVIVAHVRYDGSTVSAGHLLLRGLARTENADELFACGPDAPACAGAFPIFDETPERASLLVVPWQVMPDDDGTGRFYVAVDSGFGIGGVQTDLHFDPSLVELLGVTPGPAYEDAAFIFGAPGQTEIEWIAEANRTGSLPAALLFYGSAGSAPSGLHVAFTIDVRERAGATGISPMILANYVMLDEDGRPVAVTGTDGGVVVDQPPLAGTPTPTSTTTATPTVTPAVGREATLEIDPQQPQIVPGGEFALQVQHESNVGIAALSADVAFDPRQYQIISFARAEAYAKGVLFTGSDGQTVTEAIADANASGVLQDVTLLRTPNQAPLAPGTHRAFTLTLKAASTAQGDSDITLGGAEVVDGDAMAFEPEVRNARVSVASAATATSTPTLSVTATPSPTMTPFITPTTIAATPTTSGFAAVPTTRTSSALPSTGGSAPPTSDTAGAVRSPAPQSAGSAMATRAAGSLGEASPTAPAGDIAPDRGRTSRRSSRSSNVASSSSGSQTTTWMIGILGAAAFGGGVFLGLGGKRVVPLAIDEEDDDGDDW